MAYATEVVSPLQNLDSTKGYINKINILIQVNQSILALLIVQERDRLVMEFLLFL